MSRGEDPGSRGQPADRSQERGSGGRLVERGPELRALDAALDGALRGAGGIALIEGAAGLGKSALVAEVLVRARERGMRVLQARALETEAAYAWAVVLALFEGPLAGLDEAARSSVFGGAAALARPLADERRALQREANPAGGLFASLHGLYWLTVNLAAAGPLLMCVDDLHWSDEPSLRFLAYLAARLEQLPISLVVSARPAGAGGDSDTLARLRASLHPRRVRLRPLGMPGVLSLLRGAVPGAPPELGTLCAELTHGNPFYIHEILRLVGVEQLGLDQPAADTLRGLAEGAIARAASVRLLRAGADAVALGRALAILGDGTALRQLAGLANLDLDAAVSASDALVGEGVLSAAEAATFTHPLVREQIYDEIPPQQRGVAHLRAARLLAAESAQPERVAAQLLLAPSTGDAWAVTALRDAARSARRRGAPDSAARQLERALAEPPPRELRREILVELGDALLATGSTEDAVAHLSAALELDGGPARRVEVLRALARAQIAQGRAGAAVATLETALDDTGDGDPELNADVVADYLGAAVFEPGSRQRAFTRTAPLLSEALNPSTTARRRLLAAWAMRCAQEAEPADRVIALAERAWSDGALLADEGPDGTGWLMISWALELAEDYARAREICSATAEAAQRTGSIRAFANASYYRGDGAYRAGDLLDAQADAEQAIEAGRLGWRRYLAGALVLKANVLIDRDEPDAARATLALAEQHGQENMVDSAWLMHARGRLALADGEPAQALDHLERGGRWLAERLGVIHTILPWRADAALAALQVGERDRARELIKPWVRAAERAGTEVMRGRRLRLLGLIEGGEEGIELLRQAVACLQSTQASLDYAAALADLGAALRRAGRRSDARLPLQHALDRAHRLGARRLEARTREELTVLGLRPRRAVIAGPDSLTPSERRVAGLAADGLTNSQIAQALFVTPKTVEFHLRHVYGKLEIPGRGALRAALDARGQPGPELSPD